VTRSDGTTEVDVTSTPQPDALLTPAEVAALFRVDPKTVTRWAKSGKLTALRTLGGHRRFLESEVRALIDVPEQSPSESD
jgi:excisionase family DNA binding protein